MWLSCASRRKEQRRGRWVSSRPLDLGAGVWDSRATRRLPGLFGRQLCLRRQFGRGIAIPVIVAALVAPTVAHATFPGRNGRIAVEDDFGCGQQIATVRPDGSRLRVLTNCDASMSSPEWSPSGRRMLVWRGLALAVMRADGSGLRDVAISADPPLFGDGPSFAPDGRHFAYTRGVDGDQLRIWRSRTSGTGNRRLGRGHLPRWSPDGRTIAFIAGSDVLADGDVWLMDARTGQRVRRVGVKAHSLDVSPDGRKLLFSRWTCCPQRAALLSTPTTRRAPRVLASSPRTTEIRGVWSPDGRRVAFVRSVEAGESTRSSIWTMRADGTRARRILTSSSVVAGHDLRLPRISWQPRPAMSDGAAVG